MESVEDIPARPASSTASPGTGRTTASYLDAVESLPKGMNAGGYVGDVALPHLRDRRRGVRPGLPPQRRATRRDGPPGRAVDGGRRARLLDVAQPHPPRAGRALGSGHLGGPASSSPPRSRSPASAGASSRAPPATTRERRPGVRVDEELAWMAETQPHPRPPVQLQPPADAPRSVTTTAGCSSCAKRPTEPAPICAHRSRPAASACCSASARRTRCSTACPPGRRCWTAGFDERLAAIRDPEIRQRAIDRRRRGGRRVVRSSGCTS